MSCLLTAMAISMIPFPPRPGTAVLPTCSIAKIVLTREAIRSFSLRKRTGKIGLYGLKTYFFMLSFPICLPQVDIGHVFSASDLLGVSDGQNHLLDRAACRFFP